MRFDCWKAIKWGPIRKIEYREALLYATLTYHTDAQHL